MLGMNPVAALLGAGTAGTLDDQDTAIKYALALAKGGIGVLLCEHGTKIPCDNLRTPAMVKKDQADWEAAGFSGEFPRGYNLATHETSRLRSYIRRYFKVNGTSPNLAIEPRRSKLVIVDADTQAEVDAFKGWAAQLSGDVKWHHVAPTVSSPGARDSDGTWRHRDGGHYYFMVPDDAYLDYSVLPANLDVTFNGTKFSIFLKDRYVLIPPSTRPEGPYRLTGPSHDMPRWLADYLGSESSRRAALRAQARHRGASQGLSSEMVDDLEAWYSNTPWGDILLPLGWEQTGTDKCGCEVWGRPGRSSDKSATAHNPGCSDHRFADSIDPPIHFWSTALETSLEHKIAQVGSERTLSKLQLLAAAEHDGDDKRALSAALEREITGFDPDAEENEIIVSGGLGFAHDPYAPTPQGYTVLGSGTAPVASAPAPRPVPTPAEPSPEVFAPSPIPAPRQQPVQGDLWGSLPPGTPPVEENPFAQGVPSFDAFQEQAASAPVSGERIIDPLLLAEIDALDSDLSRVQARGVETDPESPLHALMRSDYDPYEEEDEPLSIPSFAVQGGRELLPFREGAKIVDDPPDIYTLEELLNRPGVEFLVKGWLQHRALTAVIGPPNAGKSAVVLDLVCSMAAERPAEQKIGYWKNVPVQRVRVLYVAGEGVSGVANRIAAWEHTHGVKVSANIGITDSPFHFQSSQLAWNKLVDKVVEGGYELIVFDTMATMNVGTDENSATEMGAVISDLNLLVKATNACVLLVHHTTRDTQHARGSSALLGALASEILVEKVDETELSEEMALLSKAKQLTQIRVAVTKQKDAMYPDPMDLALCSAPVPDIPGRPKTDEFGSPTQRTAVLVSTPRGEFDPALIGTVRPSGRTTAPVVDIPGMAERLVNLVVSFTCGDKLQRIESYATLTALQQRMHTDDNPHGKPLSEYRIDFQNAMVYAVDRKVLTVDGAKVQPNLDGARRKNRDAARELLLERLGMDRASAAESVTALMGTPLSEAPAPEPAPVVAPNFGSAAGPPADAGTTAPEPVAAPADPVDPPWNP